MTIERLPGALDVPGVGRVGVIAPVVREDDDLRLREGVARLRLLLLDGRCPCGARLTMPNRETRRAMRKDKRGRGGLWETRVQHEDDCPAGDERVNARQRLDMLSEGL